MAEKKRAVLINRMAVEILDKWLVKACRDLRKPAQRLFGKSIPGGVNSNAKTLERSMSGLFQNFKAPV